MVDTINITTSRRPDARFSYATLQGGALIVVLCLAAPVVSYGLALHSGGAQPALAAAFTFMLCAAGGALTLWGLRKRSLYPHAHLGLCNAITLTRGAGICAIAGQCLAPPADPNWSFAAVALGLLVLDGLDGWAARRARLESPLGARIDVETDVAFALTLAMLAVVLGQVGLWFVALGLLRPAFLILLHLWPRLNQPLPDALWRKRLAAIQMGTQVALVSPLLSPALASLVAALLLGVMVISFARDLLWLARKR